MEFAVSIRLLCHPSEIGGETFGTDVVHPMLSIGLCE
jgi:hypothetical protein